MRAETRRRNHIFFGPDEDELAYPAHHMVTETTPQHQGPELSGATMIPQMTVVVDLTGGVIKHIIAVWHKIHCIIGCCLYVVQAMNVARTFAFTADPTPAVPLGPRWLCWFVDCCVGTRHQWGFLDLASCLWVPLRPQLCPLRATTTIYLLYSKLGMH